MKNTTQGCSVPCVILKLCWLQFNMADAARSRNEYTSSLPLSLSKACARVDVGLQVRAASHARRLLAQRSMLRNGRERRQPLVAHDKMVKRAGSPRREARPDVAELAELQGREKQKKKKKRERKKMEEVKVQIFPSFFSFFSQFRFSRVIYRLTLWGCFCLKRAKPLGMLAAAVAPGPSWSDDLSVEPAAKLRCKGRPWRPWLMNDYGGGRKLQPPA